jgi:hypothetical protein
MVILANEHKNNNDKMIKKTPEDILYEIIILYSD